LRMDFNTRSRRLPGSFSPCRAKAIIRLATTSTAGLLWSVRCSSQSTSSNAATIVWISSGPNAPVSRNGCITGCHSAWSSILPLISDQAATLLSAAVLCRAAFNASPHHTRWSNMVFQGCELSLAHIRFSQMRYTDAIKCESESIGRWCRRCFGISRREARRSPLRFRQCFGQRANLIAWRIAILSFEKLVHRAPATLASGSGHFPFYGRRTASGGVVRTGREKSNRRTTGSLECQPFGAGARWSLAAIFTSSAREPAFIFRITLPR